MEDNNVSSRDESAQQIIHKPAKFEIGKTISWFWFLLWSWPLLPSAKEARVLKALESDNRDETRNWLFISVIINLMPFLFSVLIEFYNNKKNLSHLLNNGSLPILAYGLLATNFFYLLENVPDFAGSRNFQNLKTRLCALSILTMFFAAILYVLQSNWINSFQQSHLKVSFYASTLLLLFSIAWGSKMHLLQHKKISDYAEGISNARNNLTHQDNEYKQ